MLTVSSILEESVVDGLGIRLVVFFQGCSHNCQGCHNPALLPFEGGTKYSEDKLCDIIIKKITPLHRGITLSGGDPLFQKKQLTLFLSKLKQQKPDLNIWVYTGFTYEQIKDWQLMEYIDVLVDGPFKEEEKDFNLKFKGSKNQRIIDVPKTVKDNIITELYLS